MNAEELATAYLQYFETKQEDDRWAWSDVDQLVRRKPDQGWEVIRLLVNKAPSDEALAFVAAGPLEDLLKKHGPAVIDQIENECRENDRLRLALSGVWIGNNTPVFDRWYALMWKYGFAEGKRMGL